VFSALFLFLELSFVFLVAGDISWVFDTENERDKNKKINEKRNRQTDKTSHPSSFFFAFHQNDKSQKKWFSFEKTLSVKKYLLLLLSSGFLTCFLFRQQNKLFGDIVRLLLLPK